MKAVRGTFALRERCAWEGRSLQKPGQSVVLRTAIRTEAGREGRRRGLDRERPFRRSRVPESLLLLYRTEVSPPISLSLVRTNLLTALGSLQNLQLSPMLHIYPANQIKRPRALKRPRDRVRLARLRCSKPSLPGTLTGPPHSTRRCSPSQGSDVALPKDLETLRSEGRVLWGETANAAAAGGNDLVATGAATLTTLQGPRSRGKPAEEGREVQSLHPRTRHPTPEPLLLDWEASRLQPAGVHTPLVPFPVLAVRSMTRAPAGWLGKRNQG